MNRISQVCRQFVGAGLVALLVLTWFGVGATDVAANSNVHVTRFWHNHQPIYWPEWNSGVGQDSRVQYAHDSMRLKPFQNYGAAWNHPHNNLEEIFGNHDRIEAYQGRPNQALTMIGQSGGFAMSYTGSLIDNIRNLAANGWNYGSGWNSGNTQARQWTTPAGGPRLDMVGFSYHHSLTPLLPKEVFRKEVQLFKQAWWKAWGGAMDLSDHSKGFFPTEMAYSRDIIDVLVEEGYEWLIVASHHISRTSPSYNNHLTPENFQINSSPPNRADQIGPTINNGWFYSNPHVGMGTWNASPFAYQLHRVEYVNPNDGSVRSMIAVPSDDYLSYRHGYAGEGIGFIGDNIEPHANDPNRPVLVMPATDGDNSWGGGSSSWLENTPALFNDSANAGYQITTIQDFVNQFGHHAQPTHIEEGAWIFPEMCYGSPNFMKWIEPPVRPNTSSPTTYPNTVIDIENGWALKFFAYAPKMAGANWVITAEQIYRDQGGDVQPWRIQAPYDWDGSWTSPNEIELAWHIYLKGLDSGFQYYGGLGNDDETKPGLAARRAIETLQDFMSTRMNLDETGPTVLKPQRFPYNPGGYTFGWFNHVPEGDGNYLKKNPSWFYIWTLAHDVSGIQSMTLKMRHTHNNSDFRSGHNQNLTYAGGNHVSEWVSIPMTRRVLPNTRAELNAIANHSEIDFVVTSPEIADQYFAKIDDSTYPNFRGRYFDYYIEAVDARGNVTRTEIQHVFVEDDGEVPSSGASFSADPRDCAPLTVTYQAANGPLEGVSPVFMQIRFDSGAFSRYEMSSSGANVWSYSIEVPGKPSSATVYFENTDASITDNRGGQNWTTGIRDCDAPVGPRIVEWTPQVPDGCGTEVTIRYYPNEGMFQGASQINIHIGFNGWVGTETLPMTQSGIYWEYVFNVPEDTYQIDFAFNSGDDWDNNSGNDWHVEVINCSDDAPAPTFSTDPASPVGCGPITITYNPQGRPLAGADPVYIHIGRNGWQDVELPNPAMTRSGNLWTYVYTPAPGTTQINVAFNDNGPDPDSATWDNNDGVNWNVSVTDCDGEEPPPPPPSELAITTPSSNITVGNEVETVDLSGTSEGLVSDISWANALTGGSGSIPAAANWSISAIPLAVGANVITVSGEIAGSGNGATVAQDSASNYATWAAGDNRGTGFSPWVINVSGDQAGTFIGGTGFGMWSHSGDNGVEILRPFASPLAVDQTFHVRMQNGWIWEDGGSVGVALRDGEGDTLWQLYFNGGAEFYATSEGDTDIGWTGDGIDISFTVTGAGAYSVVVHPAGSAARTYTGTFTGSITEFRAWSWNNGTDDGQNSNRDYFVNDLAITQENGGGNGTVTVSDSVTVTRQDEGVGPEAGIEITDPATDIVVPNATTTYTIGGTATGFSGMINWANAANSESGQIPFAESWSIPSVPLAEGANVITVSSSTGAASPVSMSDVAANYMDWATGSNEGSGFGPWNLYDDGEDSGHFIWTSTENGHADIDTMRGEDPVSFGMFGHSEQYSNAERAITSWGDGYSFSLDIAVQWRDGNSGISFFNDAETLDGTTEIWNLNITNDGYGDTGFDYAANMILTVQATQNGGDLGIVVTSSEGGTWSTTVAGQTLAAFRLYTGGDFPEEGEESPPQSAGERNLYFNNLQITGGGNGSVFSDSVTITREASSVTPGIVITSPSGNISVPNATTTYTIGGTASGFSGMINWANAANSESGQIPFAESWSIPNIPLAVGANLITVSSGSGAASPVSMGDVAANYMDWTTGSNEGSGFGPWNLYDDGEDSGHFLWTSTENGHGDIDTMRGEDPVSFGMFGHSDQYSNAERAITSWGDGYSFSLDIAVQWRDGNSGISFFNDAETLDGTTEIWNLNITNDGYGDTGFDYAANMILTVQATQNGGDLGIVVTSSEGGTWNTTVAGQTLAAFRLYTGGDFPEEGEESPPQSAGERNLYFNNLEITGGGDAPLYSDSVTITRLSVEPGDSNGDGVPDEWYNTYAPGVDVTDPDVGETVGANGHTLRESHALNLDPRDPAQVFRFDALNFVNGDMLADWGAGQGRSYIVDYSPSLAPPDWSPVSDPMTMPGSGVGRATREGDELPLNGGAGFYRIRLLP